MFMNFEKGSIVGIVGGVIAVGILAIIFVSTGGKDEEVVLVDNGQDVNIEITNETEGLPMDDVVIKNSEGMSYAGEILAGNGSAILLDFEQSDYEKALAGDTPVFLYFYAKWCPSCRAEVPKMQAAFNDETATAVIGFRVNYKDKDTDDFEKGLASEFGIGYQHTKVALINGERVLKSPEQWDTSRYLSELNNLVK